MHQVSRMYNWVILDTPPVLAVTDAVVLSKKADAVILVAKAGHTVRKALQRTQNLIASANPRILGVALIWGFFFFGESMNAMRIIGICVIMLGTVILAKS